MSDKPLEGLHKLFRRFRDLLSRKTNLHDNIKDIFTRLFLQSSPVIRALKPKKQKRKIETKFMYPDDEIIALMLIPDIESDSDD